MSTMDKEDGEMSDDTSMAIDDDDTKTDITYPGSVSELTVLYKADKSGIIVKTLEKVDASKLKERAQRFGLNLTGSRVITQEQIDELYMKFGIESGNERHFRFDTLHLNGVDGLNTKEIFEYLEDFKPVSLEWIDDTSCNVVCQDHISTALALLVHSREIRSEKLKEMLSQSSTYHWREGMPQQKKDFILMRFATKSDKKDVSMKPEVDRMITRVQSMDPGSKNPWGDLCQSWGVYDHQEIWNRKLPKEDEDNRSIQEPIQIRNKGLAKRLGKRSHKSEESDASSSDSEWTKKQKAPRMRMHADDEESLQKKRMPVLKESEDDSFAPLSIEVINMNTTYSPKEITKLSDKFKSHIRDRVSSGKKDGVHSRLGTKIIPTNEDGSSDDSLAKSDHNVMSRVQIVGKKKTVSNVWSRLQTNEQELNDQTDLRKIIKSRKTSKSNDLRARLGQTRGHGKSKDGISLRIEIDNDYHDSD